MNDKKFSNKNVRKTIAARRIASLMLFGSLSVGTGAIPASPAQTTPAAATTATQTADKTARYVTGEVTALDTTEKRLSVRTDAGAIITVTFGDKTTYSRLPGGKLVLAEAVPATLAEISVGDRVLIDRGRVGTDVQVATANKIFVMSRADVAAKQERDQAEWQQGILGVVTALNPQTKEITVQQRGGRGVMMPGAPPPATTLIKVSETTILRRYAPDSVRFSDARVSSFDALKVGDQLRARGERTPGGAGLIPKEIVSGTFRTMIGKIVSTDSATNEVKLAPVDGGAPVTIVVKEDSKLRRLPPMMAALAARRGEGGGRERGERERGRPDGVSPQATSPQATQAGGAGRRDGAQGRTDGARAGGFDIQEMIERMPQLTVAELTVGDTIAVSSTSGTDSQRVTAITLIAGIEPLLTAFPGAAQRQGNAGVQGLGVGLPGGLDLGIGGP